MSDSSKLHSEEVESLVIASQNGDGESFGKLYDIFLQPIYRYVYYRVGKEDAEDLTELVFLKTWEHIRKYTHGKNSFSSWIFRIAHNVVIDHYRGSRPTDELVEDIADSRQHMRTDIRARQTFTSEVLAIAMKELKDQYRQVIILKYVNDLSNEEIAEIMGKSQTALRILQFRALRQLKTILHDKGIEDSDA